MQRQNRQRAFAVWMLVGLGLMATFRGLPRMLSAPFVACVICDVLGFVLLLASVVLGTRAELRQWVRSVQPARRSPK
ncbi:hypothetical protein [Streptomyces sp. WG-D5]